MTRLHAVLAILLALVAAPATAADYPPPKQGDWIARDFRFHTGEVMPELRLHHTTVGEPSGQPVLVLHGTSQSGTAMLTPAFAGELLSAELEERLERLPEPCRILNMRRVPAVRQLDQLGP